MAPLIAPIAATIYGAGTSVAAVTIADTMMDVATVAGPALAVGGMGLSAFSSIEQGQYAEKMAQYNATIAEQQAAQQAQAAKTKAFDLSVKRRMAIGSEIAGFGAAGVDANSGTPLDVMANTAAQYERDIQYAGIAADEATQAGSEEAQLYQMMGKQSQMAGWMGAGTTLFSGLGMAGMRYGYSSSFGGN